MYLAFKLFNSIKHEHEAQALARLELQGLLTQFKGVGKLTPISNFAEAAARAPLRFFRKTEFKLPNPKEDETAELAVLDCLVHELPYGRIQGYRVEISDTTDISRLIRRLGYTREIYLVIETKDPAKTLQKLFPQAVEYKNAHYVQVGERTLYRFITHQYFLEKSHYISKLSRNEKEIDNNVETLFRFLTYKLYRIPASSTMRVGKRLVDYFTIREEPSLYLTHYLHPYKGKFHPKMARALLNYVHPKDKGLVLDNFAGSGTLLVEAVLMGLDAHGIDINPLSALMTHVKCDCLRNIEPVELEKCCSKYLATVESAIQDLVLAAKGQQRLEKYTHADKPTIIGESHSKRKQELAPFFKRLTRNGDPLILDKILLAQNKIQTTSNASIRDFLLLALSGSISDIIRRRKADFLEILTHRIGDLYRRVYLFHKLNETLNIKVGEAISFEGDTRAMSQLRIIMDLANPATTTENISYANDQINAIVNSPPYSTALDYIKNDEPQLRILGLHHSLGDLKQDMMGCPRVNYDSKDLQRQITDQDPAFETLPDSAKEVIHKLLKADRRPQALRTYKFFLDMRAALQEMKRVLQPNGQVAIVIGNNHYRIKDNPLIVENDTILEEIANKMKFENDPAVSRELEKSSTGAIRQESILLLRKEKGKN